MAPEAERRRERLRGCRPEDEERPAQDVLARIPWERRKPDAERMTAEQFLGAIVG